MKRPAVFFDRDNTLIVSDGYLGDPDTVVLVPGAAEAVAKVRAMGFAVVVFSNQSGVARGLFTEEDVHRVNARLDELLRDHDAAAVIDRHEFCPHHPDAEVPRYRQASEFRKPAPGMIYQAARQLDLDLGRSWVVGDAPRDMEAGRAAGCRTILFKDPALPPSAAAAAAAAAQTAEPDFVVGSLASAAATIERNPAPEPVAEPVIEPAIESVHESAPELAIEATPEPVAAGPAGPELAATEQAEEAPGSHDRFPKVEAAESSGADSEASRVGSVSLAGMVSEEESGPERPGVEPAVESVVEPAVERAVEPAVEPGAEHPVELSVGPGEGGGAVDNGASDDRGGGKQWERTGEPLGGAGAEGEPLVPLTPETSEETEADVLLEGASVTAVAAVTAVTVTGVAIQGDVQAAANSGREEPGESAVPAEPRAEAALEPSVETVMESPSDTASAESAATDVPGAVPVEADGTPEPAAPQVAPDEPVTEGTYGYGAEAETVPEQASETAFEAHRRRSPPAVILAAKAAREAARHSSPNASPEALREAARQAAREAATGLTRDNPSIPGAPAPATEAEAPSADAADPQAGGVDAAETAADSAAPAAPEPADAAEPPAEPAADAAAEPAVAPRRAVRVIALEPSESGEAPGTAAPGQRRLEELAEQILQELRSRNEAAADFSVTKLMAGITMVISLAVLACAYLYKGDQPTLQSFLLLGLMLQALTISLLIIGRQR